MPLATATTSSANWANVTSCQEPPTWRDSAADWGKSVTFSARWDSRLPSVIGSKMAVSVNSCMGPPGCVRCR